ncbi:DUF1223 domain-containing protein [Pedobacter caeni]|uniref:DUF1223 domain-containing protein n=1 Tax=Pedobacter caeni TaxID=288992 RepID=A0A1M4U0T7_9SPHI|nr:DUF1223 domain-containing protein [Pedobacter caeni]SHE50319.1 hypothetical protein SAMN04488522_101392 [Pedobacter caeni]
MKTTQISIVAALVVLLLFSAVLASRSIASKSSTERNIKGDGFAVLELFTSEGCSSCPPADELLAKIQKEAGNRPVYVLTYHVDYWDRLGWKDAFSNSDYSKRQYQYASKLGAQVYTPQLVVNGKTEFVGSNESATDYAINSALKGTPEATLSLHGKIQSGKMALNYQLNGNSDNAELVIAVVQKEAITKVKRGENEGRTLAHAQIVRQLYSFNLEKAEKGEVNISVSEDFNPNGWEVIGLLQHPKTRAITAATKVVF